MSVEEGTIYDLIPAIELKSAKPPKYTSRFREDAKHLYLDSKTKHKTLGPAKIPPPQPDHYLKKHEKDVHLPDKQKFTYFKDHDKRPPVPHITDKPLMGLKTTKNFITNNAVEIITSIPKKPEKKFVDTRKGDTHNLVPSGLEPVYVHRRDFGEIPNYLIKRNYEMKRAQEEYDRYVAEHFRRGAMRQLTKEEWQSIVDGLKANWEDIHDQYQSLSVMTDTAPKKNRKERMEAAMKQLERDIDVFERHKVVYVAE